ncbi:transcriptional regulator, TetR family [Mycolicibacterium fluoranthenivorans]|jgi:AcrR family transcriptional regulator|uniref:Transcriptional regulator, TetR family n=2 Tax=Mycolicibacterium fluoranthenivorans TaxID=258505 RepID=A0A1G4WRP6_9MYCO|nr:transcriptional regulator, TetR family [Mycolicibacterium fluoranthenivorans]
MSRLVDPDETTTRVLRAALAQFELVGVRRTTMEDVSRRSNIARASLYRRFPTKNDLVEAVILSEVRRYFEGSERAHESSRNLEEHLISGIAYNVQFLREHTLLKKMLLTEPEVILPKLTIDAGAIIEIATQIAAIKIATWLPQEESQTSAQQRHLRTIAELNTRLTISFALTPQSSIDLNSDKAVREFAKRYLLPALTGGPPVGA